MPEQDPSVQHSRQALLQQITRDVLDAHSGDDVDTVRDDLVRRLAEAGFPEQPEKWVNDTAAEIADSRHVVVDRRLGIEEGTPSGEVPHGAGG